MVSFSYVHSYEVIRYGGKIWILGRVQHHTKKQIEKKNNIRSIENRVDSPFFMLKIPFNQTKWSCFQCKIGREAKCWYNFGVRLCWWESFGVVYMNTSVVNTQLQSITTSFRAANNSLKDIRQQASIPHKAENSRQTSDGAFTLTSCHRWCFTFLAAFISSFRLWSQNIHLHFQKSLSSKND